VKRAILVSVAACSLLVGGAITAAHAADAPAGSTVKVSAPVDVADARADGKTLFSGLYFGQGAVGEKLLESDAFIGDHTGQLEKNSTPEARQAILELTAEIDKASPQFFAEFSADVRSGNPFRVKDAVEAGAAQIEKVAETEAGDGAGVGTCVVAVNVGAFVNVVAGINVATQANVVLELNLWWSASADSEAPVKSDEQIAAFTEQLRTI
jgi:SdpC family antimicrobial peptide